MNKCTYECDYWNAILGCLQRMHSTHSEWPGRIQWHPALALTAKGATTTTATTTRAGALVKVYGGGLPSLRTTLSAGAAVDVFLHIAETASVRVCESLCTMTLGTTATRRKRHYVHACIHTRTHQHWQRHAPCEVFESP